MLLPVILTTLLWIRVDAEFCESTEKCDCFKNQKNFEFQCPPNVLTNRTIVHVYPLDNKLEIDCNKTVNLEDYLPVVNLSSFTKIFIQSCPPPTSFHNLANHFNIENVQQLVFNLKKGGSVTTPLFHNLTHLKRLNLRSNDLQHLEPEVFTHMPLLTELLLDQNRMVLNNTFEYATELVFLSIPSNDIEFINPYAFKNLKKLKKLHLWSNRLTNITSDIFYGLNDLKLLELSCNSIEVIEPLNLPKLTNINLRGNKIKIIPEDFLKLNTMIEEVRLNENDHITLEGDVFSNLRYLKSINLASCELNNLSPSIFANSTNLEEIKLNNNNFSSIPKDLFKGLNQLKYLYLHNNEIESLPDELFYDLINLEELSLEHNRLSSIGTVFAQLKHLQKLNLSYNKISHLDDQAFLKNINMKWLYLSNNRLTTASACFDHLLSIEELDMSRNAINSFPTSILERKSMKKLTMSYNNLQNLTVYSMHWYKFKALVNLENNKITRIRFEKDFYIDRPFEWNNLAELQIKNNRIICDCLSLDLAKLTRRELEVPVKIKDVQTIKCLGPGSLTRKALEDVPFEQLTCPLVNCTEGCKCKTRPIDQTVLVDCSYKNMTSYPELKSKYAISLNLTGNFIKDLPVIYGNLKELYLGNNSIEVVTNVPKTLEILDLSGNGIKYLTPQLLANLNGSRLRNLSLGQNPWRCDCRSMGFFKFLRDSVIDSDLEIDVHGIICSKNGKELLSVAEDELCPKRINHVYVYVFILVFILLLITSSTSLYYKFRQEIYIWLFSKGWFLWLVTEEELDKDKTYDVFLSFSHKDEDFVIENLVPVLESGSEPYNVCIHYRDFIPGEYISTQIVSAVCKSRRTLVILSANFLSSVWGKAEFKTAHMEAMREGRPRVIVVIYGDVDLNSMDEDLKAYIKSNTYIKWGDPWFWERLRYALPHKNVRLTKGSKKHANIMRFIDDKFKLITRSEPLDVFKSQKSGA